MNKVLCVYKGRLESVATSFRDVRCWYSASTPSCYMIVCRPLIARTNDHTHYITFVIFFKSLGNISTEGQKIIINIWGDVGTHDNLLLEACGCSYCSIRTERKTNPISEVTHCRLMSYRPRQRVGCSRSRRLNHVDQKCRYCLPVHRDRCILSSTLSSLRHAHTGANTRLRVRLGNKLPEVWTGRCQQPF